MTEPYITKKEIKSEIDFDGEVKTVEVCIKQEVELVVKEEIEIRPKDFSPITNIYDGHEVKEETEIIPQILRSVWDDDESDGFDNDVISPETVDIFKLIDQYSKKCETKNNVWVEENDSGLKCHKRKIENEEYICDICKKKYKRKFRLAKHIIKHGQEQVRVKRIRPKKSKKPTECLFKCEICKRKFLYECRLANHMKSHNPLKPFQCDKCNRKFSTKGFLTNHMSVHYAIKRYSCKFCSACFSEKIQCKKHIYRKHNDEIPKDTKFANLIQTNNEDPKSWIEYEKQQYACNTCSKIFYEKSFLINHLKQSCLNKHFSCTICNRLFKYKKLLTAHMCLHSGERNHVCEMCNKTYATRSSLRNHTLLKHSTVRPHKCDFCNSTFITRSQLRHHVLSKHSLQPQFSCAVCKQTFRHDASLRKHMIVHTGSFRYACNHCNKSYILKSALNEHIKMKHSL